ncbi:ISL3 family transposase [Lactiplantibacillus pentosus]|uniref:ISL3 family transposase n=2 Tax=Lactiplantibacillus TaxID=2767842 RepID=A0AAW8WKS2_LACPE|nr:MULTISPECIES: ISL3 family transposase [Lactiplantibacillus]MBU7462473.1 ISL3 family transposase [Lactiplantibacillus pentosus]MBU7485168.1 ISL3 family transposase [Lactiplantibacillus sp. 30.2.29]MBU7488343.1 ISL3 family transposase [Lactiplantibacillus pentosus]MBU7501445.1 ISL3 family transposase [Lactiplantibacillus pentosus]MBU7507922.1 ISL3 family transposase [Lactiplantibacillus pentosus]
MNYCTRFLLGIKDTRLIFDPKFGKNFITEGSYHHQNVHFVHLLQTYPCFCSVCQRKMLRNGFKLTKAVGLPAAGVTNILCIRKQKFICPKSKKCPQVITKIAKVAGIQPKNQISDAVRYRAVIELGKNISQTDIAENYAISPMTIMRFSKQFTEYIQPNYHWLPADIAVDDFKSGKFAKSGMSLLVMDSVHHRTIDIIESRTSNFIKSYFLKYSFTARKAVKTVTVDLYSPYRPLIHELFPNAIIIADHFHIVVQAFQALNSVRLHVMKQAGNGSHDWRALKWYWKLLMKDSAELDYQHYSKRINFQNRQLCDADVVDLLLNMSDELKKAYNYYQQLLHVIHHQDTESLSNLLNSAAGMPEQIKKANRTLRKHQSEIINSFKTSFSNGPVEGTNNKIKVIKRTAYGFRNFENFRLRILLSLKNSYVSLNYHYYIKKAIHSTEQIA